jgi:ferrous iron transport protein A
MTGTPATFPLSDLQRGASARVDHIKVEGPQRRRLMDLGFVPDTIVEAIMRAPLGDPMAYRVRGATIALRADQAALVIVTEVATEKDRS